MNTRSVARVCGVLYVATILAGFVSGLLLMGLRVDVDDIAGTLPHVANHALWYRLGVSIDFVSMVGVMMLACTLWVILKPYNPYFALLALGLRIGEVMLQAGARIPDYLLLTLSQYVAASPATDPAGVIHLGQILVAGSTRALWLSFVFFSAGSLFNNYLFYRSRLIPAALAVYGVISTILYTAGSLLALVIDLPEGVRMPLMLPLVLFELTLGFYLTIFGVRETPS